MTGTVKEALSITIGKYGDAVILKVEDTDYHIGRATSYSQALDYFAEFLDAEVVSCHWESENCREVANIVVSKDDVDIKNVNGVPKFSRRYRYKETVKEALERAFSNSDGKYVFLKAENMCIRVADSLKSALKIFSEFLDAKVTGLAETEEDITIFISKDDAFRKPNPENIDEEPGEEPKEPKMFENLKRGCVAENAEKINIQELKAFLEKKTDIVDALQQKILMLKNEIADCIEILRELEPKQAESSINILKLFVMTLEEK